MISSIVWDAALMCSLELIFIGIVIHLKYPYTFHKKTLIIIIVSLAVISMSINPTRYWDIYRHYASLDEIRNSDIGFLQFLFNNRMRVGGADYAMLYFFNVLRYIAAITGFNRLLAFSMTLITYGIWYYVTMDWCKEHRMTGHDILISIMLSMTLMPYIFVNSGLRNSTAMAIATLAIYNHAYKKHSLLELCILFFLAFTTHFSIAYVALLYFLSLIKYQRFSIVVLFFCTNIFPHAASFFFNSKYEVLMKMASSFIIYTRNREFGLNYYLLGAYTVLVALAISFLLKYRKGTRPDQGIGRFIFLILASTIFNVGYTEFTLRPLYSLGVLSTPLISFMYGDKPNYYQKILTIFCILVGFILVTRVSLPEYIVLTY